MQVEKKKQISVKKCKECNKFFDPNNINFFLNLAISKKIHEGKNEMVTGILKDTIKNQNDFEWCYCYSEEKLKAKNEASNYLQIFEDGYKNFNKIDIEKIGLDFFSNKNYFYLENGRNFSKTDFFNFLKITKNSLDYEEEFSFDFLTYDKMKDEKFLKFYKSFFNYPNFLLIDDIELLSGKSSSSDSLSLKNILTIVKERVSNNKVVFFSSGLKLKTLKETLYQNFWDGDEIVIEELISILEDSSVFETKDIVLKKGKDGISISSKKITVKTPKIVKKEIKKEKDIIDEREIAPISQSDIEDMFD